MPIRHTKFNPLINTCLYRLCMTMYMVEPTFNEFMQPDPTPEYSVEIRNENALLCAITNAGESFEDTIHTRDTIHQINRLSLQQHD